MSETIFEKPQISDTAELAQFAAHRFTDTFGFVYPPEDLEGFLIEKYSESKIKEEITNPDNFYIIAKQNGKIIGYVLGGPMGLPIKHEDNAFEMYRLYVAEDQKGKGTGKILYQKLFDYAKSINAPALYLGVWVNNARARAFYTRLGFEIVGKYFYKVGKTLDDERIMRLGLEDE